MSGWIYMNYQGAFVPIVCVTVLFGCDGGGSISADAPPSTEVVASDICPTGYIGHVSLLDKDAIAIVCSGINLANGSTVYRFDEISKTANLIYPNESGAFH